MTFRDTAAIVGIGETDYVRGAERSAVEQMIEYMFFVDEAPLSDTIQGVSTFAQTFSQRGPRDSRGRSLRDFDLRERLFRYPLSYLIYTESFNALPAAGKNYIYKRLDEILRGEDTSGEYTHLSETDRRAILEILEDTKPDFVAATQPQFGLVREPEPLIR